MLIFDRYVLRTFLKVLAVSFLSLTGLFIVIDLFANLEEFLSHGERQGSVLAVLAEYYGARVLSFFDRTSNLLALLAAIFTITSFHRSNELMAVMAAGISKARAIRVLILAAAAVAALAAVNREFALPSVRDRLSRNAQDWMGDHARRLTPRRDHRTQILLGGKETVALHRQIVQPAFRLQSSALAQFGRQLVAATATYYPATEDRPGGYLLDQVSQPANIKDLPSVSVGDPRTPVILTPHDQGDWLEDDQCFVVSDVTFEHLAADSAWQQFSSTWELFAALRNPSLDYGADVRVQVHRRLVQPVLDMTLLFLGLPLVLSRSQRNMFIAAFKCLGLVGAFFVICLACQALGNAVMVSPALAAWLPVFIFVPLAYAAAARRWE